ncbi:MAG: M20/M25/M40 family metallo-hydrolase, partial [Bacteroidales bacterium]
VIKLKEAANEYKTDEPLVLGIGSFMARGATNIIPDKVNIKGTVRTFDEKARKDILGIITDICGEIEKKYRVKVELNIPEGYPVLVNDKEHVRIAMAMAKEINGENMVCGLERRMGSEDFAHYSLEYPVVFFRTGIGGGTRGLSGLHTPGFTMDEKALLTGLKTISYLGIMFTGI